MYRLLIIPGLSFKTIECDSWTAKYEPYGDLQNVLLTFSNVEEIYIVYKEHK